MIGLTLPPHAGPSHATDWPRTTCCSSPFHRAAPAILHLPLTTPALTTNYRPPRLGPPAPLCTLCAPAGRPPCRPSSLPPSPRPRPSRHLPHPHLSLHPPPCPPAAITSSVNAFSDCTKATIYAAGWSSSTGPTFTDGSSCSSCSLCSSWSDLYLYPLSPPLVRRPPALPPPLPPSSHLQCRPCPPAPASCLPIPRAPTGSAATSTRLGSTRPQPPCPLAVDAGACGWVAHEPDDLVVFIALGTARSAGRTARSDTHAAAGGRSRLRLLVLPVHLPPPRQAVRAATSTCEPHGLGERSVSA